jgi:hypothetical protein
VIHPRRACGIGLLAASLVLASVRPVSAAPDATALAVQADAAHDEGRMRESAELYVRAYRTMTRDEKAALGEVIVVAAVEDLHACWKADPDTSFARTAGELLDEYERDTKAPLPAALAAQREWIDSASAETSVPIAPDPEPPTTDTPEPSSPSKHGRVVGPVLLGVGVAAAIGGAAMIGFGAPLARRAEAARREAFADERFLALPPGDPGTIGYVAGWEDYVRHERRRTTAFATLGAVFIAAGVGLATYGIIRIVRQRRSR